MNEPSDIKEVAQNLGLSKTSVYLYLNDPDTRRVSEKTKHKIARAIHKLNYRINVNAQSLARRESRVIAILIPLEKPYFRNVRLNEMLSGIQSVLFSRDYKFIFIPARGTGSSEIIKEQLKTSRGYDGFILFGTQACRTEDMKANIEQLLNTGTPFVVMNMPDFGYQINQIIDRTPTPQGAIQYLLSIGHQRILLMAGRYRAPDTERAIREYRACYEANELTCDETLIRHGGYETPLAKSEMLAALDDGLSFSAVYCLSDTIAMGVYEALRERELAIPDDVSVIGRDDAFFAQLLDPPLTTLRVPMFEIGERGAEILLEDIKRKGPPRKVVIEDDLILRGSTRVYPDPSKRKGGVQKGTD